MHYLRPEEDQSNTVETSAKFSYPRWYWRNSISYYMSQPAEKPPLHTIIGLSA